ncbi:MAG: ABC transporter ATP-binding protein [Bacillota bacterium]|nr:ABC transporter ATP-binding protein [Bacillota bacterium]
MSGLEVRGLAVEVPGFRLGPVDLRVQPGEVLAVLGPSGAGKTLLLRTVAGFQAPARGRLLLGGRDVTAEPPERRRVGYVVQEYALFPHRTVLENVRFPLRYRPERGRPPRFTPEEALRFLGIEALADRRPATLSGGERQRVALARALVREPELFLFDEPLSALDAPAREALREELRAVLERLGVAALYVTHDRLEALVLGDRIALLDRGRLVEEGERGAIFARPRTLFAARFLGMENLWPGRVEAPAGEGRRLRVRLPLGVLTVAPPDERPGTAAAEEVWRPGMRVTVGIRPEKVRLLGEAGESPASPAENRIWARVERVTPWGAFDRVRLDAGVPLVADVAAGRLSEAGLRRGSRLPVELPAGALHLIPDDGGEGERTDG